MNDPILRRVLKARGESRLLQTIASVRADGGMRYALGAARLRPLSADEVRQLEALGNACDDWARVRVADGFDGRRVRQSSFHGDVILGAFPGRCQPAEGVEVPAGIYHSTVANSVVGNNSLVRDVKLLANCVVGAAAVLFNCGSITADGTTTFGNGQTIPVGIESGGRDLPVYAEIDLEVATRICRSRSRPDLLAGYARLVAEYAARAACPRGIIEAGAVVRNTVTLRNTYVGPCAEIDGATLVSCCTLLSSAEEPARIASGSCVTSSIVQWGASCSTLAILDRSVLSEHAHVERHGKVSTSVVGPNTTVAEGEVTASLVGPFVGFHHQALLIAALWPEGKGNVSCGANAGSNHTTKAPDQEFLPGEGLFLGLGVNVKFPSDFSRAPYTVLASGVSTLPQKLAFPFALVNTPSVHCPDVSPAYNELTPAWVLSDNIYAVLRNQAKYRSRNRARRLDIPLDVFRPETVDLMLDAARRLEAVPFIKDVYSERDVPGLGKNFLLETARLPAIAAYRFYASYYALLGLLERAQAALRHGQGAAIPHLLAIPSDNPRWEHQRRLLAGPLDVGDALAGLRTLPGILKMVAEDVERSKAKDDQRGPKIIDDYAEAHPPATQDPLVRQTWEETRRLLKEVNELLATLKAGQPSWEHPGRPESPIGAQAAPAPLPAGVTDLLRSA